MSAEPLSHTALTTAVRALHELLDGVADTQPVYLPPPEQAELLVSLARAEARVHELRLRVMAASSEVARAHGSRDVGAWLANELSAEPSTTARDLTLARSLDADHPRTARALAAGDLTPAHARVVCEAVDALPDRVGGDIRCNAELELIGYCSRFRPSEVRRLGRHILEVVAPEVAEAEEARLLEREERAATDQARLSFRKAAGGVTRLTGAFPDAVMARLRTYLEAFTSPRVPALGEPNDPSERLPLPRRYAAAFTALLEHLDPARMPHHGGDATTVMVTIGLDDLRRRLASAGTLDGDLTAGPDLTAEHVRRLACTAGIIPVVLGGKGEILDLGRARRLFSSPQRKALRLRDRRCRAEGCWVPATWCEAHHRDPWSRGGRTDLADGVLLCHHHHRRIHDDRFQHKLLSNGDYRFHRRT